MRFEIDWASVIAGSKFTRFALFSFVFKGSFLSTTLPLPRRGGGCLYLEGRFNGGFFAAYIGGAYFWNFTI